MASHRISPRVSAGLAIICFIIATICFSGIVLTDDTTGRIIFGLTWSFVGICWLGWSFQACRKS